MSVNAPPSRRWPAILTSARGASLLSMGVRYGGAALGVLLQMLIAREWGSQVLGGFYLALSLSTILSMLIGLGYPAIITPVVAQAAAGRGTVRPFITAAAGDMILASLLLVPPLALAIWFWPSLDFDLRVALLIGLATAPAFAAMRMLGSWANALRHFHTANLPELMLRQTLTLLAVVAAIAFAISLDAPMLVAINLAATVLLTLGIAWRLSQTGDLGAMRAEPAVPRDTEGRAAFRLLRADWRRLGAPMILATLFITIFGDLAIVVAGLVMGAADAGVFGLCIKVASLVTFAVQVVHQTMLRDAADAHLSADTKRLRDTVRSANRLAFAASLVALIAVVVGGHRFLALFGPGFVEGYACLVILTAALPIRALGGPGVQLLMTAGRQSVATPVYLASILALILANLILVPSFGLAGAGMAVFAVTALWVVWLAVLTRRALGFSGVGL